MGRRKPEEAPLTDPVYLAAAQAAIETVQRLELWRVFRLGENGELELGGLRRLVPGGGHKLETEYRSLNTGEWCAAATGHPELPDMSLRANLQNPLTMGRRVLTGVANFVAAHHLRQIPVHLEAFAEPPDDDQDPEGTRQLALMERDHKREQVRWMVRAHLYAHNKQHHIKTNWLHYTKSAWALVDREALGLMLRANFRAPFGLSDYLEHLPRHGERKRLADLSPSLLPWERMLASRWRSESLDRMENGLQPEKKCTEYADQTRYSDDDAFWAWGLAGSSKPLSAAEKRSWETPELVDWSELARQPFSFVHAMVQLPAHHHAGFLKAWLAQDKSLRKRGAWLVQNAVHGYAGCPWNLDHYPRELWTPLMQLMLEAGTREQKTLGYGIVVKQAWREDFFTRLDLVAEHWRNGKNAIPDRVLSAPEMARLLPEGDFRAAAEERLLEQGTAVASVRSGRARRL